MSIHVDTLQSRACHNLCLIILYPPRRSWRPSAAIQFKYTCSSVVCGHLFTSKAHPSIHQSSQIIKSRGRIRRRSLMECKHCHFHSPASDRTSETNVRQAVSTGGGIHYDNCSGNTTSTRSSALLLLLLPVPIRGSIQLNADDREQSS